MEQVSGHDLHSAALQSSLVANPKKTDIDKNFYTKKRVIKDGGCRPSFVLRRRKSGK
jgi:hypothetical protein